MLNAGGNKSWGFFAGRESVVRSDATLQPTVIGWQANGGDSRYYVDNVPQYVDRITNASDTHALSGIVLGRRYAITPDTYWDGLIGMVLLYDGVPPADVRDRMTRLVMAISNRPERKVSSIASTNAIHIKNGNTVWSKAPDQTTIPASLTKMLTLWVARQHFPDSRLDEVITAQSSDNLTGSGTSPAIQPGDQITVRNLMHLMMMNSHNAAARIIARIAGDEIDGGGRESCLTAMNEAVQAWGWEGAVFYTVSGEGRDNRASCAQMAELIARHGQDPTMRTIMGTMNRPIPVGGPNARELAAHHIIEDAKHLNFPDLVACKTGGLGSGDSAISNVALLFPNGEILVTMGSPVRDPLYPDAKAIRDGLQEAADTYGSASTDENLALALQRTSSKVRRFLDERYVVGTSDVARLRIDALLGATSGEAELVRTGGTVELTFEAAALPADLDVDSVIPFGYKPLGHVYGGVFDDDGVHMAHVFSDSRLTIDGNDGSAVRGTLVWATADDFPAGDTAG